MESEMSLQNSSPHFRGRTHLRDFVKDSMYREVQGSSTKGRMTDKGDLLPVLMYGDSPRLQSKMSDGYHGSYIDTRQRTCPDHKESVRVLAKLQEAPQYHSEPRKLSRSLSYQGKDRSSCLLSKDAPRFSCDGREVDLPWDDLKSTLKLKDRPRFSLGSKDDQLQSLNDHSKSNVFLNYMQMNRNELEGKVQNSHNRPGHQVRPPSVVAKLMGLETLPDLVSSRDIITGIGWSTHDEEVVKLQTSNAKVDPSLIQLSSTFSKKVQRDSSTRCWAKPDSSKKPLSRVSNEPAPWNQIDGSGGSRKPGSRTTTRDHHAKAPAVHPTVYREIEKRLKDLEFTRSGRDLRALKQILEAMQSKGLLGAENKGLGSNLLSQKDHEQKLLGYGYETRSVKDQISESNKVLDYTKRRTSSSRHYESPIVIMKPANHFHTSGQSTHLVEEFPNNRNHFSSSRAAKDLNSKSLQRHNTVNSSSVKADRTHKISEPPMRSQPLVKNGNAGWGKNSRSTSPRMQQKKLELENRSQLIVCPDSTTLRSQSNKQKGESNSPGSRQRLRNPDVLQSNDHEVDAVWNSNHRQNENSVQNEGIMWSSKNVVACGSEKCPGISSFLSPSMKVSETMTSGSAGKKYTLVLSEDESSEFSFVPPEYSSPVSVLDNPVVCKDSFPYPVKDIGTTLREKGSDVLQGSSGNPTDSDSTSLINCMKLQNIDNLVLKLRRLNCSNNEAHTNYIASLSDNTDLDRRYISEILLASGLLLRELGSNTTRFKYHSSEHPINPELFLALEQPKASAMLDEGLSTAMSHRMLIFDTVNEILARKLSLTGPFPGYHLLRSDTLARRWASNSQKLLGDLCSEIEEIQAGNPCCISDEENAVWKDITSQSQRWVDFDDGISGAVLDIERLIFKDLVNEIVIGEPAGMKARPRRHKYFGRSFSFC